MVLSYLETFILTTLAWTDGSWLDIERNAFRELAVCVNLSKSQQTPYTETIRWR